ncbi:hypothetical protein PoB_005737100 [Plakobranchus ocellatus]|uniref:Uncharacterized protein n=1 Tax=Plakobranchus ocellatus TaxID=259542 RepID=A0AAV4C6B8_9GAST|nr:hypothetical protein PoB_005737100 [Plakobranchus ocellatus]
MPLTVSGKYKSPLSLHALTSKIPQYMNIYPFSCGISTKLGTPPRALAWFNARVIPREKYKWLSVSSRVSALPAKLQGGSKRFSHKFDCGYAVANMHRRIVIPVKRKEK